MAGAPAVMFGTNDQDTLDGAKYSGGSTYSQDLFGMGGDDFYVVNGNLHLYDSYAMSSFDIGADIVHEDAGGGDDVVFVALESYGYNGVYGGHDFTLAANVENMVAFLDTNAYGMYGDVSDTFNLYGNDLNNTIAAAGSSNYTNANIQGFGGDDTLVGKYSNDTLNGGTGKDSMYGGEGDDLYFVDNAGDVLIENGYAGDDTVYSSITYTLPANVEKLFLTGTANINGTGNAGDNDIYGNSGNNTLTGNDGEDYLVGYAGKDILFGGSGNDNLYGGIENDKLDGGNDNDTLVGGYGNDTLIGGDGEDSLDGGNDNDSLDGGSENDTLLGGYGNDTLNGGDDDDKLYGSYGNDKLIGGAGGDSLHGGDGNDNLDGGNNDDYLYGENGDDTLIGGGGNDNLYGGSGNDKMDGGAGNDVFYGVEIGDTVTDSGGIDTIYTTQQLVGDLGAGIENLTLDGNSGQSGRGNSLNNTINGDNTNNLLEGLAGNDTLNGSFGNDVLKGGDGNDFMNGGYGNDLMDGGKGNDTYIVDSSSDAASETLTGATGGTDTVFSSAFRFTLGTNIENLTLTGGAVYGYGNAGNNLITGNGVSYGFGIYSNYLDGQGGNDTLDGGAGGDLMFGGDGNDTFIVDNGGDIVVEYNGSAAYGTADIVKSSVDFSLYNGSAAGVENLTLTGSNSIDGYGNALNNFIIGNAGNNVINGYGGNDTMQGGAGNDTYYVDSFVDSKHMDVVTEAANAGTDRVNSTINYTLGANLEDLYLYGSALNGTGNNLNNIIVGNGYGNVLKGVDGNDSLYGADGNDTLDGGNGNNYLDGGNQDDSIIGGNGNDTLIGGDGSNILKGGAGNDTYKVGKYGSATITDSGGMDSVITDNSGFTLTNGSGVENLTLNSIWQGKYGAGNDLNNLITGTSFGDTLIGGKGNDTLDGGGGADTMDGGIGNDIFMVDNSSDFVNELAGASAGIDIVKASVTFALNDTSSIGVENLTLTGSSNIYGYGNSLANTIIGNDGNNYLSGYGGNDTLNGGLGNDTLNGGIGNDSMTGGAGNDIYYVDSTLDKVVEAANGGIDSVYSSVSFSVAALGNVENVFLTGYGNTNATGNGLNNILAGNDGNNSLSGGAGNDTLVASHGNDALTGGTGDDIFNFDAFHLNFGNATITDFSGGADSLELTGFGGLTFNGAGGSLNAGQFHVGTSAVDGDDYIIYDDTTGALYYDGDGDAGGGQVQIFSFTNFESASFTLTATDIFG